MSLIRMFGRRGNPGSLAAFALDHHSVDNTARAATLPYCWQHGNWGFDRLFPLIRVYGEATRPAPLHASVRVGLLSFYSWLMKPFSKPYLTVPAQIALLKARGLLAAKIIGVLDDRRLTVRKLDDACLTPVRPLSAEEMRALSEREGAATNAGNVS